MLATDVAGLRHIVAGSPGLGDDEWRHRVADLHTAPPFVVLRLWLDRPVRADRAAFVGTGGRPPLDNVSVLERYEREAAQWAARTGGSVVELHAYSVTDSDDDVRDALVARMHELYPETVGATILDERLLRRDDCPRFAPGDFARSAHRPDAGSASGAGGRRDSHRSAGGVDGARRDHRVGGRQPSARRLRSGGARAAHRPQSRPLGAAAPAGDPRGRRTAMSVLSGVCAQGGQGLAVPDPAADGRGRRRRPPIADANPAVIRSALAPRAAPPERQLVRLRREFADRLVEGLGCHGRRCADRGVARRRRWSAGCSPRVSAPGRGPVHRTGRVRHAGVPVARSAAVGPATWCVEAVPGV